MITPEENEKLLQIIEDFGHFLGMKTYYNIIIIMAIILALISQLIYYYNYKSGIKAQAMR